MNLSICCRAALLAGILAASPALAQVQDYRDLKYPALPEFKIPKPTVHTLPNGMRIFLLEDRELPLITVTARIRTGAHYEPAEKAGLAELMGEVQRTGGTSRQTGDEIDDFLAARAAIVETSIGGDFGFATLNCLKQSFDEVLRVFADILRTPAFAPEKLEVAKVAANTAIARRNDFVGQIAAREIRRIVYGPDSPMARLTEYATIKAITREDLLAWHQKYYHPNNILLGVVGDFQSDEMLQKLAACFEDWAKGPEMTPPPVPFRKDPAPGYYFIEKSDVNQANIAFGHLGIETRNPDYFAVQVMNEILGGGFASRMFSNVRSRQGLAYSVWGRLGSDYLQPGLFQAGLQTKLANTSKAIASVRSEIAGIIENPPTPAELKRAKDSILNSFIFNFDSKTEVLSQQLTYAYYGLPADFLERYRANIEKVEAADVTRVARKYIHPDQLAVLVVGKAADLDQPLSNLGQVVTLDISIPPPADDAPQIARNADSRAAGKKIWAAVVAASGGDALKTVDTARSTVTVSLQMGEQAISLKQTSAISFPDKLRQVIVSPMGEQTIILNADEAFLIAAGKSRSMPADAVQEMKKELARTLPYLLRYHDDPDLETHAAGEESLQGVRCQILALSFKGVDCRCWVAPDGKILKQSYRGAHPLTRAPGTVENLFADYRSAGPLLIPYKQIRRIDGKEAMTTTVDNFEANPSLEPDLFSKPAE